MTGHDRRARRTGVRGAGAFPSQSHKGSSLTGERSFLHWSNTFESDATRETVKLLNPSQHNTMHITLRLLTLLVVFGLAFCQKQCPTLERPSNFDKPKFVGTWYAVRGIEHSEKSNTNTSKQSKKCSEITISSKSGGESWKFNWNSKNKPAKQFTLKHNAKAPGLLEGNGKGSFNSVQVTKVAEEPTLWAATFCRTNGGISSVILSNTAAFNKVKVDKVTQKLAAQGLDVSNSYDRCVA